MQPDGAPAGTGGAAAPVGGSVAIQDVVGIKEQTLFERLISSQAFWVTVALVIIIARDELSCSRTPSRAARISTTSPATSPSSASWRSAWWR